MNLDQALSALRQFSPTGDEGTDEEALRGLINQLGELKRQESVREELIAIVERNPDVGLGSPGPILHTLEEAPLGEHVLLLVRSLGRNPAEQSIWMAERCFRAPTLSEQNRAALVKALRDARETTQDPDVAASLDQALDEYGNFTH